MSIQIIPAPALEATSYLTRALTEQLIAGKHVLWLLSGGSAVEVETKILNTLTATLDDCMKKRLSLILMDERFGPVGYKDSNWHQLVVAGAKLAKFDAHPTLIDSSPTETLAHFMAVFNALKQAADVVIGLFGVGSDGHTAGLLPGTVGIRSENVAELYTAADFERITLTAKTLQSIDIAYLYAQGPQKTSVLNSFLAKDIEISVQPVQLLKKISDVTILTNALEVKP